MRKRYLLDTIGSLKLDIGNPYLIFLKGNLGVGKTTLSQHIINNILGFQGCIISPTYNYYRKYGDNIYHFDLYRLKKYDEFFSIGGEDIFDNNEGVILVEWPDLIEPYYTPDLEIILHETDIHDEREIELWYKK